MGRADRHWGSRQGLGRTPLGARRTPFMTLVFGTSETCCKQGVLIPVGGTLHLKLKLCQRLSCIRSPEGRKPVCFWGCCISGDHILVYFSYLIQSKRRTSERLTVDEAMFTEHTQYAVLFGSHGVGETHPLRGEVRLPCGKGHASALKHSHPLPLEALRS